jgi:hypothetical protein
MATIIPAKDVGKVLANAINEALAQISDDKTKQVVLNAFCNQMFYGKQNNG